MNEQWRELKETIIELRDNDGTGTQQEVCKFLANLMGVLEKGESLINNDAISRQAVLDGLASIAKAKARSDAQKSLMGRVMFFAERLPPVTPQQKMGRWITSSHGFPPEPTTVCSECGFDRDFYVRSRGFDKIKYCPNCGAKMAESEDKE
jgi:hypothetical protein